MKYGVGDDILQTSAGAENRLGLVEVLEEIRCVPLVAPMVG